MEEELTTLMHMEFCQDEDERLDIAAMAIDCEVFQRREISFENALKKYSITEKQFWEKSTLRNVPNYPNTPFDPEKSPGFITEKLYNELKACETKYEMLYVYGAAEWEANRKRREYFDARKREDDAKWRAIYGAAYDIIYPN
jgi:hypothetical protein